MGKLLGQFARTQKDSCPGFEVDRYDRFQVIFKCGGIEATSSNLRFSRKASVIVFDGDRALSQSTTNGLEMALPDLPKRQSLSAQTVYAEHCGLVVLQNDGPYALS